MCIRDRSYAIGLLYDNPNPYYVIAMQNGVLSVCRDTGYGLQIHPCDATSPTPVSYTHLDVYKRQHPTPTSVFWARLKARRSALR